MRVVLQRVSSASVNIDGQIHSEMDLGILILLGIETEDTFEDVEWLVSKICGLRIFNDGDGKMNLSIGEVNGQFMVVSQFTLHASTKKGNRPSYIKAARPESAIPLYELFIKQLNIETHTEIKTGIFGADMQVSLVNDGPVTILIDSKNRE
ncbi:MAG: D-tyrosyl-tRNA(Tyr) deacylase [Saprospiraceae bacterium]|jgi:D-tyrosyl-tRNA(Tyr) deacylase|nr:D-tyrosyl-tRNA(Tyr) deacylase [Saprospiraceae bacterium]